MKVTDLRRKLMATLVAGGMLAPGALHAADLNANLVVNGDFENVDLNFLSAYYNAPFILDWNSTIGGFAYSHDLSGESVPDFANGTLAGGGHWYFSPGNSGVASFADALKQEIDVSTGETADAIAAGTANYNLSAFFSTYASQADRGFVQIDFLGAGNLELGTASISSPVSPALAEWTQFAASGLTPTGTQKVRISSWGEVFVGSEGSADGYTDNIDFRITAPGLPGDYNDNGVVDAADYAVWRDHLDGNVELENDGGLGTPIDQAHYDQWKANFGQGSGTGSISAAAVPEPSSVLLVGIGLATLAVGTRRSKSAGQGGGIS